MSTLDHIKKHKDGIKDTKLPGGIEIKYNPKLPHIYMVTSSKTPRYTEGYYNIDAVIFMLNNYSNVKIYDMNGNKIEILN